MFLPSTKKEMDKLGWKQADVIIVTGDAYIDSPFSGAAVVGKTLKAAGFKVAIISQPDTMSNKDIMRLGSPKLYWGVTAGATDSLVANYTSTGKRRKSCDFTPGGNNNRRPDRACIIYSNLIKRYDRQKRPVVLGGIEASLRRMAHYDMLTDKIRRPLLFDAKADFIIYGMGEFTAVQLAESLKNQSDCSGIKGLCYITNTAPVDAIFLPTYEDVSTNKKSFHSFFKEFYSLASTMSDQIVVQQCNNRYMVQNPPYVATRDELDYVYSLGYEREAHPQEAAKGQIKAVETIRHSITTHRGCYGECNFCAIAVHQGRAVISRSAESIINEAENISRMKTFSGIISDAGGPTANMYGTECAAMKRGKPCPHRRCLFPDTCPSLKNCQSKYIALLERLRRLDNVKRINIASGIRCDIADKSFIKALAAHHTGGQIKLAPEHVDKTVLSVMGKCGIEPVADFIETFLQASKEYGKQQFVTCYFMAAHPGSTVQNMEKIKEFSRVLKFTPEQVQIFTPTPSTWSTCMYYTGRHYISEEKILTVKDIKEKILQKDTITLKKRDRQR